MRRRTLAHSFGAATALLVVLLGPLSAKAHEATPARAVPGSTVSVSVGLSGDAGLGGLVIMTVMLGIGLWLRRPRRLAVALAILLTVFAFDVGVHSAHHVGDPLQAATCTVAIATAHLAASPVDTVDVRPIIAPSFHLVFSPQSARVALCRRAPHAGRAPPTSTI